MIFGTAIGRIASEPRLGKNDKGIDHLYILIYTKDAGKKFYVGGSLWGDRAAKLFPYLRIDQPLSLTGRFQDPLPYTDQKTGEVRSTMNMILVDVELLDATLGAEYPSRGSKAKG